MTDAARPSISVGLVDGSAESTSRRFSVVLDDDAVVQLDDLVGSRQVLPDGTDLAHYGIVVEGYGQLEGADLPSDTRRITADALGRLVASRGRKGDRDLAALPVDE